MTDTRVGADGLVRPVWAADDGDMQAYYDTEWGVLDTHLVVSHRRGISGLWNEDGTRRN